MITHTLVCRKILCDGAHKKVLAELLFYSGVDVGICRHENYLVGKIRRDPNYSY